MTDTPTYPPYESGQFSVTDGHSLYYERFGKLGGVPVLFVHGGPGAGFSEEDKAFFDPELFDVLLFEQRGSGRSTPFASLEDNHTDALVDDITRLLDAFDMPRVLLFGGSWGSTLSLVYAIRNPSRISAMLLRGIFLADARSIEHFIGGGVEKLFPEVWERFVSQVPDERRGDLAGYYLEQMQSPDEDVRERFCFEWGQYELSLIKLDAAPRPLGSALRGQPVFLARPLHSRQRRDLGRHPRLNRARPLRRDLSGSRRVRAAPRAPGLRSAFRVRRALGERDGDPESAGRGIGALDGVMPR
jgi:proline iminopeptidase